MDATDTLRILESLEVPDWRGVYVLGCIDRRVTVYSQQVRALNLAAALIESQRVRQGDPVVIVGAGAAGLTCAAGLRHLGAHVTLLETRGAILSLFQAGSKRWLHPGVYDWPLEDWDRDSAGLPVLDWKHGRVDEVRAQFVQGWDAIINQGGIQVHLDVRGVNLGQPGDSPRAVTWNPGGAKRPAAVILAVGFGLEPTPLATERRYWEEDDLDAPRLDGKSRRWLLSGCGDGALTDLLRLCLRDFRHHEMLQDFASDAGMQGIRAQIQRIERDAAIQDNPARLHDAYINLSAPWLLEKMRARRRSDTDIVLNAPANFLTRGASALNRFLAGQLYQANMFDLRPGHLKSAKLNDNTVEVQFDDNIVERFDNIIRRHGPRSALAEHFPAISSALDRDRRQRQDKPVFTDQTRTRYWSEGTFGPEARLAGGDSDAYASCGGFSCSPGARSVQLGKEFSLTLRGIPRAQSMTVSIRSIGRTPVTILRADVPAGETVVKLSLPVTHLLRKGLCAIEPVLDDGFACSAKVNLEDEVAAPELLVEKDTYKIGDRVNITAINLPPEDDVSVFLWQGGHGAGVARLSPEANAGTRVASFTIPAFINHQRMTAGPHKVSVGRYPSEAVAIIDVHDGPWPDSVSIRHGGKVGAQRGGISITLSGLELTQGVLRMSADVMVFSDGISIHSWFARIVRADNGALKPVFFLPDTTRPAFESQPLQQRAPYRYVVTLDAMGALGPPDEEIDPQSKYSLVVSCYVLRFGTHFEQFDLHISLSADEAAAIVNRFRTN